VLLAVKNDLVIFGRKIHPAKNHETGENRIGARARTGAVPRCLLSISWFPAG